MPVDHHGALSARACEEAEAKVVAETYLIHQAHSHVACCEHVYQLDHVLMLELPQQFYLPHSSEVDALLRPLALDSFQGHKASCAFLLGQFDNPPGSLPKGLDDFVVLHLAVA